MQGDQSALYERNSLKAAVYEGKIQAVRKIISSCSPAYLQEWEDASDGYVLLRIAVQNRHTDIAKLLLRSGVRVNRTDEGPCNTPLHFAVLNGDADFVLLLLQRGTNINAKNILGATPLHNAVTCMKMDIIYTLLNQGASVNVADNSGVTPLHIAVKKNSIEMTYCLLSRRANINSSDCNAAGTGNGYTPLHIAVENGNEEITKLLITRGADVDAKLKNGKTSMHFATQLGYVNIIQHLLQYRANVNSVYTTATHDGWAPLHLAVESGHNEIVQLLLSRGADVNAKVKCGKTSLHIAAQHGFLRISRKLVLYEANVNSVYTCARWKNCTPLLLAADNGHEQIVRLLLSRGADANVGDPYKQSTALFCAIERGDVEVVKLLLKNGARQHSSNEIKFVSPLQLAAEHGRVRIAELLIKYGGKVNSAVTHGIATPLHVAAVSGQLEVTNCLLRSGANVRSTDEYGYTALHYACMGVYKEIVAALIDHGADVEFLHTCGTWDGCTPLHIAAYKGYKEIVELLISRGANVNTRDSCRGWTALCYATTNGCIEIVELLLRCGASQQTTLECDFQTPLHMAARFNRITIAELLLKFGADIDFTDKYGETAVSYGCSAGHEEIVAVLLEHGADMTIESNYKVLNVALNGIKAFCRTYHDSDTRNMCAYVNTAYILKCHMVKLKVANLYTVNDDIPSITSDDEEETDFSNESDKEAADVYYSQKVRDDRKLARNVFQNECEKEIASMKNERIVNTDITFYDFLSNDIIQLTAYARNYNIVQAIESQDYKNKFPIYASMIQSNFTKGKKNN